jgi:GNAT superfamily N-acetyltransferase
MSPTMIDIRPATEADTTHILQFIRELARYERLEHEVIATEAQLRQTLFGARPYAEVLIATAASEPVGFALFFHNYSTFRAQPGIYLEDLYVQEHMRGHGVGRQLLRQVARLALERRCGRLEWAVLEWNTPSIAFYRNLGARPMQDWRTFRLTGAALEQLGA